MLWTRPLPKVVVPMMVARSWSLSAPVTISEALAEKPLTSTTMGLSVATGPVAVSSSLGECRPGGRRDEAGLEDAGDVHGLREQAAAVVAQVEDEPLGALLGQLVDVLAHVAAGQPAELVELDVADLGALVVDDPLARLGDLDRLAHDLDLLGLLLRCPWAARVSVDRGALLALDAADARLDGGALGGLAVDRLDDVAGGEARGLRRRPVEHRRDDEAVLGLLQRGADARVGAALLLLEVAAPPWA